MVTIMIFLIIYIPLLFLLLFINRKDRKKQKQVLLIMSLILVAFGNLFYKLYSEGYKISYTNLIYAFPPFNNLGVRISGPLLSDIVDSHLVSIQHVFVENNLTDTWIFNNVFGRQIPKSIILNIYNWVYLFGLEYGQSLNYILKTLTAFITMFLYMKQRVKQNLPSFVSGIVFAFSSVMVAWAGWDHTGVVMLAPLLFFIVDKLINNYIEDNTINLYKLKHLLYFALVVAIMLCMGMPTYVAYFMYLGILYVFYRLISLRWDINLFTSIKCIFSIGLSIILGALISVYYLYDLFMQTADYASSRLSYSNSYMDLINLRTLIFPYPLSGDGYTLHFNERTLFTGLFVFFVAGIFILAYKQIEKDKKNDIFFWMFISIIVFIFVFVEESGVVYKYIPLINSSLKYRILVLFNFSGSILSGYGLYILSNHRSKLSFKNIIVFIYPIIITLYATNRYSDNAYVNTVVLILWLMGAMVFLSLSFNKKSLFILATCLLVTLDVTNFAKDYIPLIDNEAEVLPTVSEETEEILEENETLRSVFLGSWNFTPNTNSYYGLNVLSGHDFVLTNADIKTYYSSIDPSGYSSRTKFVFTDIMNSNLLSYASVNRVMLTNAFLLNALGSLQGDVGATKAPQAYLGNVIRQTKVLYEDDDCFWLLLSTYGNTGEFEEDEEIKLELSDSYGNLVKSISIPLNDLVDNSFQKFDLEDIDIVDGDIYTVTIRGVGDFDDPIAYWTTDEDIYEGSFSETSIGDDLCLLTTSDLFDDNVFENFSVETGDYFNETQLELNSFSERAFFAEDIIVVDDEDSVLNVMKEEYYSDTAIVTEEVFEDMNFETNEQANNEVNSLEIDDDSVSIEISTDGNEILCLNDYYTDDWKAYVDGEEVDIYRINYLFQGICITGDGEHEVVFKYEPSSEKVTLGISAGTLLITLGALFFIRVKEEN